MEKSALFGDLKTFKGSLESGKTSVVAMVGRTLESSVLVSYDWPGDITALLSQSSLPEIAQSIIRGLGEDQKRIIKGIIYENPNLLEVMVLSVNSNLSKVGMIDKGEFPYSWEALRFFTYIGVLYNLFRGDIETQKRIIELYKQKKGPAASVIEGAKEIDIKGQALNYGLATRVIRYQFAYAHLGSILLNINRKRVLESLLKKEFVPIVVYVLSTFNGRDGSNFTSADQSISYYLGWISNSYIDVPVIKIKERKYKVGNREYMIPAITYGSQKIPLSALTYINEKSGKSLVLVTGADLDESLARDIKKKLEIEGFPDIPQNPPYSGKMKVYVRGGRTVEELLDANNRLNIYRFIKGIMSYAGGKNALLLFLGPQGFGKTLTLGAILEA